MAFKLTIHMVLSLDGFIAKKDNSVDWFETADNYERGIEISDQDVSRFLKTIDCYVMGANTFAHAVELSKNYGWPYGDTPVIVLTHKKAVSENNNIEYYSGDLGMFVEKQLKPRYKNVWVAGGAVLGRDFIRLQLADKLRLSIMPIILGDGLPFFDNTGIEQLLHLEDVSAHKSGMVELCYQVKK